MNCEHTNNQRTANGERSRWCPDCGAIFRQAGQYQWELPRAAVVLGAIREGRDVPVHEAEPAPQGAAPKCDECDAPLDAERGYIVHESHCVTGGGR